MSDNPNDTRDACRRIWDIIFEWPDNGFANMEPIREFYRHCIDIEALPTSGVDKVSEIAVALEQAFKTTDLAKILASVMAMHMPKLHPKTMRMEDGNTVSEDFQLKHFSIVPRP